MPVNRTCLRCAAPFTVSPSAIALDKGKYCSRVCAHGTVEQRFWNYVERLSSGCWRWTGTMAGRDSEYGRLSVGGRLRLAHHVAYTLFVGPIPAGKILRHCCPGGGNTWCVNPEHLLPGTYEENGADMMAAGRHWSQTGTWSPPKGIRLKPPHCPTCSC